MLYSIYNRKEFFIEENNENNEIKEEVINTNEEKDNDNSSNNNSNKKVIYIILGIAAFLLVCLIVFCGYYNSLTFNAGNNSSNTTYAEDTNTNVDDEDNTSNDNQSTSSQSESTNQSNTKTYSKTKDIDISEFDFGSMFEDINNSFSSGNNPYILKCTMINQETLETSEEITQISQESFYTIVEKLKSAKSFDLITSSFFGCPPRNIYYAISLNENDIARKRKFSIGYALNNNDFLVGYGNYVYAFHYENASDIDNFIESLK